jgi:hypothetical protein
VRRKIWYDFIYALKNIAKKSCAWLMAGPVSSVFMYVAQQQIYAAGASLASLSGACKFESITLCAGCAEKYRRLNISIKCGFGVFARRRLIWSPGWKMVHKQPAAAAKGLHKQGSLRVKSSSTPMGSIVALEIVCTRIKKGLDAIALPRWLAGKLLNP